MVLVTGENSKNANQQDEVDRSQKYNLARKRDSAAHRSGTTPGFSIM